MSDLRQSFHERSKLWGSFRKRLSSQRLRLSDKLNNNDGVHVPLNYEESSSKTRRIRTGGPVGSTAQVKPITCFPSRGNLTLSVFLCNSSSQRFAELDEHDDALSTKPSLGVGALHSTRRCSDSWLMEKEGNQQDGEARALSNRNIPVTSEIATGKNFDFRSKLSTTSDQKFLAKQSNRDGQAIYPSKQAFVFPTSEDKGERVLTPRNISILEKEISRLTSVLNKRMMDNNRPKLSSRRNINHIEDVGVAATDTEASSSNGSSFSFRADFSHFVTTETCNDAGVDNRVKKDSVTNPTGLDIQTETLMQEATRKFNTPLQTSFGLWDEKVSTSDIPRVVQTGISGHKDIAVERKMPHNIAQVFRPIIAESTQNDDMYDHEIPSCGVANLLVSRVRNIHTTNAAIDAKHRAQSIFRSSRQVAGKDWHKYYHDHYAMTDDYKKNILKHIDKVNSSCLNQPVAEDMCIRNICFSYDDSNLISEMTDSVFSPEQLNCDYSLTNEGTSFERRKECIVFYHQHQDDTITENDEKLVRIAAVNAKDDIKKFEAKKLMEIEHPKKFGYIDFTPIHEQTEHEITSKAYTSYEETAKRHFTDEALHWAGSESYSLA